MVVSTAAKAASFACRRLTRTICDSQLLGELCHLHHAQHRQYDSIHLASHWGRVGKLAETQRIWLSRNTGALEPLVQHTLREVGSFSSRCISMTVHGAAKAQLPTGASRSALFEALASATVSRIDDFAPNNIAIAAWSFAKAEALSQPLSATLALAAGAQARELQPRELAMLAYAFGVTDTSNAAVLEAVADAALQQLRSGSHFEASQLSQVAHAVASAGLHTHALFDALETEMEPRLPAIRPREVAGVLWALGTAKRPSPKLWGALSELGETLRQFRPFELSILVHGLAKAGCTDKALYEKLAAVTERLLSGCDANGLSDIANAFCMAQHPTPTLFEPLAAMAANQMDSFEDEALASIAKSFAKVGYRSQRLFDGVARVARARAPDMSSRNLARIAHALVSAEHAAPGVLLAFAPLVCQRAAAMTPRQLGQVAWAFAHEGVPHEEAFESIAAAAAAQLDDFSAIDLSHLAWAFAVDDNCRPASLFNKRFPARCEAACSDPSVSDVELRRFHQYQLWCLERGNKAAELSAEMQQRCLSAFQRTQPGSSDAQKEVFDALYELGCNPQSEVHTQWGYTIDLTVRWHGALVGLEVDGCSHFRRGSSQPTRSTCFKRRQLRAFGLPTVSISTIEFETLRRPDAAEQRRLVLDYLSRLLDTAPSFPPEALTPSSSSPMLLSTTAVT